MIAPSSNRSLLIYKNHENPLNTTWELTRRLHIGPLEDQTTKVEQGGSIEVCTYTYSTERGKNARFGRVLCDMYNNYDSAESHIDDFDTDLTTALELR